MDTRKNQLIIFLVVLVLVLFGALLYFLLAKPLFDNYILDKQEEAYNKGVEDLMGVIIQEVKTCQPVPLFYYNQTINITAVDCL